jgi:hypothetical protein
MGSGNHHRFSSIRQALGRSFVGPDTHTVHFPIRRLAALSAENNAMNFTKVSLAVSPPTSTFSYSRQWFAICTTACMA